jgi:hypothetical protein
MVVNGMCSAFVLLWTRPLLSLSLPLPVRPRYPHILFLFSYLFNYLFIFSSGPDNDNEEEFAEDEGTIVRKRARSYSASDLNSSQKEIIHELLLKKKGSNDAEFAMDCVQVLEHLETYHPKLAKLVPLRTLQRWRNKLSAPVHGPLKKRGAPAVIPQEHRLAMGTLLKDMGNAGSPMNWVLAKPVLLGYLEEKDLMALYSEKPQSGKISLGQTWVNDLFLEFDLPSRKQTTDAQNLPDVPYRYCSPIFRDFRFILIVFLELGGTEAQVQLSSFLCRLVTLSPSRFDLCTGSVWATFTGGWRSHSCRERDKVSVCSRFWR